MSADAETNLVDRSTRRRLPIAHLFIPADAQTALCGTPIGDGEIAYPARDGIEKCIVCLDLSHARGIDLADELRQA